MSTNPAVLKNKGAQILLLEVQPVVLTEEKPVVGEGGELIVQLVHTVVWRPKLDDAGDTIEVAEWVRFDNGSLALLQSYYGSMEEFQAVSEVKPNEAVAVAIATMLSVDPFDKGAMAKLNARLNPDQFIMYQVVVMAMLSIANGVDPTKAALMIEEGRLGVQEQMAEVDAEISKSLDEAVKEREERTAKKLQEAEEKAKLEAAAEQPAEGAPETGQTKPPTVPGPESQPSASTPGSDGFGSGSASDAPTASSGASLPSS